LALKHLATIRKQEEISTAQKRKQISKNIIAITHNEEGNANDEGIHPF
jgi:hypothetical protein